jgi:pyruvate/2-oxoglutarate dehydrogenase complex dihydrolipoamide dehydrogenase (E3) component
MHTEPFDAIVVGASRQGVESWMRGLKQAEVIVGDAHFLSTATPEVGGRRLTAPRIFLNVGGRSVRPDLPGIDSVPTLDNVSILELDRVPEHLVIVGGSYIGLEFAQLMRRFGAEVKVVERSAHLLPREDADVSAGIRSILENEGVRFAMGSACMSLAREGARITVGAACATEQPVIAGSPVLLAVGRRPNTDGLGLDRAGTTIRAASRTASPAMRCSSTGRWVASA